MIRKARNHISRRRRHALRPRLDALETRTLLAVSPPSGLVAWWPADGDTSDLVGGRSGVLAGGASYTSGKVSQSFDSIGDGVHVPGWVQVADDSTWDFGSNDFSINLWVNFNPVRPGSLGPPAVVFVGHDDGAGDLNKWTFGLGSDQLYFHMNDPVQGGESLTVPFVPDSGRWYNLGVTRGGSLFTFYVDGSAKGTATSTRVVPDASAPLTIGEAEIKPSGTPQFFMDGSIDEVQIYQRALPATEVANIAAAGSQGFDKSTVVTSPVIVTSTNAVGPGSLSWAITQVNYSPEPGVKEIHFAIPTTDPGYHPATATTSDWWSIQLQPSNGYIHAQELTITRPVVIDGYTQPGASKNTQATGNNAVLKIEMSPAPTGFGGGGLYLNNGGSAVFGLAIHGFGIRLSGGNGNRIAGSFLGADITGSPAVDGGGVVTITSTSGNNIIGSSTTNPMDYSARNLIYSFSGGSAVVCRSNDNLIAGNVLSGMVEVTGSSNVIAGNDISGTVLIQGSYNRIGTTSSGGSSFERNIIRFASFSNYSPVELEGDFNTLAGNYIGTDATGTQVIYSGKASGSPGAAGAAVFGWGRGNTIGGSAGAGNVINQAGPYAVDLYNAEDGLIEGNFIGTDAAGTHTLSGGGIRLYGSHHMTIKGNIIGGHASSGYFGGSSGLQIISGGQNVVESNAIGSNATGTASLSGANGLEYGVFLSGSNDNTIGGTTAGAGNTIAFNNGAGVFVEPGTDGHGGTGNVIRQNSIDSNLGLGIDHSAWLGGGSGWGGPDANIQGGQPTLAGTENYPIVTSVATAAGQTTIQGFFNSTPGGSFVLEFFASVASNASGFGQGEDFLGSIPVTTDISGNASFSVTFNTDLSSSQFVAATATNLMTGNTSEFSPSLAVGGTQLLISLPTNLGSYSYFWYNPQILPGILRSFATAIQAETPSAAPAVSQIVIPVGAENVQLWRYSVDDPYPTWGSSVTDSLLLAVQSLDVDPAKPGFGVTLNFSAGIYSHDGGLYDPGNDQFNFEEFLPINASSPAGVTLSLTSSQGVTIYDLAVNSGNVVIGSGVTVEGHSPALVINGGHVTVNNGAILKTDTDSPTVVVSGGTLTVRDSTILQQSESYVGPAVLVEAGALDLGASGDPGGNTLDVSGPGEFVHAASSSIVTDEGNEFAIDGVTLSGSRLSSTMVTGPPSIIPFGLTQTITATVGGSQSGSGIPTGNVDFFDATTGNNLGSVVLTNGFASLSTASLPVGPHTIKIFYGGDASFVSSMATIAVSVVTSIIVLDPSANGALTVAGESSIEIPGAVVVNSSAPKAITANGAASIRAGSIQIVGGFKKHAEATLVPTPSTGVSRLADPLAGLASPTGGIPRGSVNLTKGSLTIDPGIYSQIKVSGKASLILNPGVYIIAGGGITVSGHASVTGTGVMIYNAGSSFPSAGGSFGGITISGDGVVELSAPSGGLYAGVLIFQARENTRAISLAGDATLGMSGVVYAPSALLTMKRESQNNLPLIVNQLKLGGDASSTLGADGTQTSSDAASAGQLLAGDLWVALNDPNDLLTADKRARIWDAITSLNVVLAPYNVVISQVDDSNMDLANVVFEICTSTPVGGLDDGVLGCTTPGMISTRITLVQGWNWYQGSDPAGIAPGQFDFETVVIHELGHALGLGHSADPTSVMSATLVAGVTNRNLTVADLKVPDADDGDASLHARVFPHALPPASSLPVQSQNFALMAWDLAMTQVVSEQAAVTRKGRSRVTA